MKGLERKHHIPSGARRLWQKDVAGEVWHYESPTTGKIFGLGFQGNRKKPNWHHEFKDFSQRQQTTIEFFRYLKADAERKAQRKEEKKQALQHVKVSPGDVFYSSWGYDQTNIDFYQVTAVKGGMAHLKPLKQVTVKQAGFMCEYVKACPGEFLDEPEIRRRISVAHDGKAMFRIDKGRHAWAWDGKQLYQSHYA